jgi:hypothetical protein
MKMLRFLLPAAALALLLPSVASAVQITAFGQLFNNSPFNGVDFNLNATSVDAAQILGGAVIQHYTGTFCITSAAGCGGTNILSGSFSDAAFGALGGQGLVLNVNSPPDTLNLSSSVIPATDLASPNSFNLTFSNVTPLLSIDNQTIASFGGSFSGSASASVVDTPEPKSLLLLAVGLLAFGVTRARYRA